MTNSTGAHLTTTRINRLFRPLRAKCTALAEFTPPRSQTKPHVSITYSRNARTLSRTASADHDAPPLAILQPPETLGSRIHLDRTSLDNLQLSRKIYEVRDAFRSLVHAVLGADTTATRHDAPNIRSLTALCAAVVGENIQEEIIARQADVEDELEEPSANNATEIQEELYEAVPLHHRSHAVISHAIHFVLETCPHYPTLLTALLEVCLAHTLTTESHLVLHTLFLESIRSSVTSSSTSPLLHPAHINYLTTLRATCCSRDYRASANYHRLETSTFTALLVGALSQSHVGRTDAWTSKPVARLARELLAQDFHAFLQLCTGLVDDIVETDGYQSRGRVKRKSHPPEPLEDRLRPRLARWLKSALDRLASRAAEADGGDPAATLAYTQDLRATTDFLLHVFTTGFHRTPEPASPRRPRAMDALLCLSTYCLASPAFPALPPSDQAAQAAALSACAPTTESFSALVGLLFTMPPAPDPASPFDFPLAPSREPSEEGTSQPAPRLTQAEAVQVLRRYARELRAHGLFLLEASLWGNALRKVEDVLLTGGVGGANPFVPRRAAEAGPGDDLHALREELVGRVERAEARCFDAGAPQAGVNAVASVPLTGEWVWEEMVGSWVQKSPVAEPARKRRRLEPGVRRLPAMELSAPRKTRAQAKAKKTSGPAQRQRQRHSMPTTVTVVEGTSSGASSQMARSRQTTPTLVASPRRDDDEETLASSEFEDFPGLSQSKKRARRRASQSDCELRKPQAGAGCASSGEEEEEEEEERLVLPMKSRKDASHDVRPRVCAPRRRSSASSAEEVKAIHVSESSSGPKPKARGSLQRVAPRRSAPTQRLASPFASASAREDRDDEFESMLPGPEDLSSDDLNLFAYPSSPVRGPAPRRRISLAH